MKPQKTFHEVLKLLTQLEEAKIWFSLRHSRNDAITVDVNVPGQRWEIEFVDYGDEVHIEIERFVSNGHIDDESALTELFANFSDKEAEPVTHDEPART